VLVTSIIAKTRDEQELSTDEIQFMIHGMLDGSIADYQISAWSMAILCRGMTAKETATLTECMLASGGRLARTSDRPRVDKHSTGGLGDKVSLILAPLVACFDLDVPMLSGRGLGITGGTLDKLESYDGYRCDLTQPEIAEQLNAIGCVITGTTPQMTPADRKLYSLRDVTGTVPSIALITASILSKKLAESLDSLVLDVKFGSGAFMGTFSEASDLARSLSSTAKQMGLATRVVLSDMNQPLGKMVGNACEANEVVDVLQGAGPTDVRDLTLRLSAELLVDTKRCSSLPDATNELVKVLQSGRAFDRYVQMIEHQGGTFCESIPLARRYPVLAEKRGWLASLNGQSLGHAVIGLGGGRRTLGDSLDHSVGLEMLCRIGDPIDIGQPLINILAASDGDSESAANVLQSAIEISPDPVTPLTLIPSDIDRASP